MRQIVRITSPSAASRSDQAEPQHERRSRTFFQKRLGRLPRRRANRLTRSMGSLELLRAQVDKEIAQLARLNETTEQRRRLSRRLGDQMKEQLAAERLEAASARRARRPRSRCGRSRPRTEGCSRA